MKFLVTLVLFGLCGHLIGNVLQDNLNSIDSPKQATTVQLYPNPAQDVLHLQFGNVQSKLVRVMSLVGQTKLEFETSDSAFQFDVNTLIDGTYILIVEYPNTQTKWVGKFKVNH